jgi:hypothetical protein
VIIEKAAVVLRHLEGLSLVKIKKLDEHAM